MASIDNIMSMITWLFLEKISDVQIDMSEMPTFPPAIKLTSGWNRFSKRTMYSLQIRIYFWKKSHDLVD